MAPEEPRQHTAAGPSEADEGGVERLREQAALSLIEANLAAPLSAAVAANILADDSLAEVSAQHDDVAPL